MHYVVVLIVALRPLPLPLDPANLQSTTTLTLKMVGGRSIEVRGEAAVQVGGRPWLTCAHACCPSTFYERSLWLLCWCLSL